MRRRKTGLAAAALTSLVLFALLVLSLPLVGENPIVKSWLDIGHGVQKKPEILVGSTPDRNPISEDEVVCQPIVHSFDGVIEIGSKFHHFKLSIVGDFGHVGGNGSEVPLGFGTLSHNRDSDGGDRSDGSAKENTKESGNGRVHFDSEDGLRWPVRKVLFGYALGSAIIVLIGTLYSTLKYGWKRTSAVFFGWFHSCANTPDRSSGTD